MDRAHETPPKPQKHIRETQTHARTQLPTRAHSTTHSSNAPQRHPGKGGTAHQQNTRKHTISTTHKNTNCIRHVGGPQHAVPTRRVAVASHTTHVRTQPTNTGEQTRKHTHNAAKTANAHEKTHERHAATSPIGTPPEPNQQRPRKKQHEPHTKKERRNTPKKNESATTLLRHPRDPLPERTYCGRKQQNCPPAEYLPSGSGLCFCPSTSTCRFWGSNPVPFSQRAQGHPIPQRWWKRQFVTSDGPGREIYTVIRVHTHSTILLQVRALSK